MKEFQIFTKKTKDDIFCIKAIRKEGWNSGHWGENNNGK